MFGVCVCRGEVTMEIKGWQHGWHDRVEQARGWTGPNISLSDHHSDQSLSAVSNHGPIHAPLCPPGSFKPTGKV